MVSETLPFLVKREISLKLCQFVIFWINVNHYLSDRGVLSRDSKLNKKGKILKSISYNIN